MQSRSVEPREEVQQVWTCSGGAGGGLSRLSRASVGPTTRSMLIRNVMNFKRKTP